MQTNSPKPNGTYKKAPAVRWPGPMYWVILIVTVLLLISLTLTLFVSLMIPVVSEWFQEDDIPPSGGDVGGDTGNNNTGNNTGNNTSKFPVSGGTSSMVLPSATPAGNYLSSSSASAAQIEGISSQSAVLVDISSGTLVAQKNADTKIYPASMTKIMTLLVACERAQNPNALLTVTQEMADKYAQPEIKGASLAFEWEVGNQVTVEDALYMVIYESDTYACWLLADYVAGSESAFVGMMNDKARSLGLTSTSFANCTGLYNANHYTTCREMAAIMAAVMKNPTAKSVITKTEQYSVTLYENGKKTGETVKMWSGWYTGRLEAYRWGAAAPYYAGNGSDIKIVAGKTGYEKVPTNCFVTAGLDTVTGKEYVCVQVGRISEDEASVDSKKSTDDTRIIYQKYAK